MYARSATGGLHSAKTKQHYVYAKSATGGLHSAKPNQSITCTPKTATGGGLHSAKTKQSIRYMYAKSAMNRLSENV